MSELLIILALVLLNGIFSGAEIAILTVRKTRIAELEEEGNSAANAVATLRKHPESFLATVQIGITVIGATAAAFGGASLAKDLVPLLMRIPALAPFTEELALVVVVALVSYLSLVLGELVPKSLALRAAEPYALFIARPLALVAWSARPLVVLLTWSSNLVLRLFGDRTTFIEARLSREEIQQMVGEATTAGSVDAQSGEIASRALEFSNLDAYTVMVPRSDIVTLPRTATVQEIALLAREKGFGRVPIYEDDAENIIGFINLRDALAEAIMGHDTPLERLLHPVVFVPDSMPAPALLRKLQAERTHLALVIDEQGTIIGLVTIEDLVEELVGDILSENDAPVRALTREADGSWLIPGSAALHEINRELGVELPEGEFSTIAGLCIDLAGSIPQAGTVLQAEEGLTLEVVEATPRRVKLVRLRKAGPTAP